MSRGVTQKEMADAIGMSVPTYRRLERGLLVSPTVGYLVNAALALGVELEAVAEPRYLEWTVFDQTRSGPPPPEEFWRRPYVPTDG